MFASQHYRHGIMDEWGNYLAVKEDVIVDEPKKEEVKVGGPRTSFNSDNEKRLMCTGQAWSIGGDLSVGAGPVTFGVGVEQVFGYNGGNFFHNEIDETDTFDVEDSFDNDAPSQQSQSMVRVLFLSFKRMILMIFLIDGTFY